MNETQIVYGVAASVIFLALALVVVIVIIQRSSRNRSAPSRSRDHGNIKPPPDLRIPTEIWGSGQAGMYPPETFGPPAPPHPSPVCARMPIKDQLHFEIQNLRNMGIAPKSELYRNPRSSEYYVKIELPEMGEFPQSQHELHVFVNPQYPEKESDWFLVRKYFDRYGEWSEHCLSCARFMGSTEQMGSHPRLNDYGEYTGRVQAPTMSINGLLAHIVNELASAQPDPSLKLPNDRAKSYTERISM